MVKSLSPKHKDYFVSDKTPGLRLRVWKSGDKVWDQKTKSYIEGRKLKMCTIQSFKGWERRNVIMLIPRKISKYFDSKFYTSLTRVREKLFIINLSERYKKFSKDHSNFFSDQL